MKSDTQRIPDALAAIERQLPDSRWRVPLEARRRAISSLLHAAIQTRAHVAELREKGIPEGTDRSIAELWSNVHERLRDAHEYDLADSALVKADGWSDPAVWDDPRYAGVPVSLDYIIDRCREMTRQLATEPEVPSTTDIPANFQVAITYAGSDRVVAQQLAETLRDRGLTIFYDRFYPEYLLGGDLAEIFDDIFRHRSLFCVMIVSEAYRDREWTRHERRSALARAVKENGNAYILPLRLDDTDLPGLPSTIGYLSFRDYHVDEIADIIYRKVRDASGA